MIKRAALLFATLGLLGFSAQAEFNEIRKVSIKSNGTASNQAATGTAISGDGTYTAFVTSSNLIAGSSSDSNDASDVFLHSISGSTVTITLISHKAGSSSSTGDGASDQPSISSDGRYTVFSSSASDLVSGDDGGHSDIFLFDKNSGDIIRVSEASGGVDADGDSSQPKISADGLYITFVSSATNLVAGDSNDVADVFLYATGSGTITRLSVSTAGVEGDGESSAPTISSDGHYVAFASSAANLVSADTNAKTDIFLRNTIGNTTVRVSVDSSDANSDGDSFSPAISDSGNLIAFSSDATDLVSGDTNGVRDVFVRNISGASTDRISVSSSETQASASSDGATISGDGRYVAFISLDEDLVTGDDNQAADAFVRDRTSTETTRISVKSGSGQVNGATTIAALSNDATHAALVSAATNLVSADSNQVADAFRINLECLLSLTATTDSDSDSTLNCSEDCGDDPLKTVAGQCGCGTADTDTDTDGTADCNDECDSNPGKTEPGICGCVSDDSDLDGNGCLDCLQPVSSSVPRSAGIELPKSRRATLYFPGDFSCVTYYYRIKYKGRTFRTGSTNRTRLYLGKLQAGKYTVSYYVKDGTTTSQRNLRQEFVVR
ncbi:MAG: calcium-binding protein [Oligoflexia bacterium]|nr:calcium-binding protein [Oligoflexia bacterium]